MIIKDESWQKFIEDLRKLSDKAADLMTKYMETHDYSTPEGRRALIDYAYALATKYGEGATEKACQMYDAVAARTSKKTIPPADPAPTATYPETARAVNATMMQSKRPDMVGSTVGRLVKQAGVDTTVNNALRDGAEWAWIPNGDTCAFCLTLASQGWMHASKKAIKNGHTSHIHAHCDCTYAIRFDGKSTVEGYDPEELLGMYYAAGGDTPKEKINYIRRQLYAENREVIREQQRAAYAKRNYRGLAKASARFVNQQELLYRNSAKIEKLPDFDDFVCHGTPDGFFINIDSQRGSIYYMTPKEYASRIRNSSEFKGNDIRIISCQTGLLDDGAAQQLANELGVKVYAPTEAVNIDEDGRIFVSDNDVLADMWYNAKEEDKDTFVETGRWRLFKPKPERR